MQQTKLSNLFLLWLGTAISIAEIVTGTLIAPLGWGKGISAIIIGHLIGCFLFLLPAAYLSAIKHQPAIAVTQSIFGKSGVTIFSGLNALQLLGWTAVMIVNAQLALNSLSQKLFNYHNTVVMAVIVAGLIIIWLLLNHQWLFRINNLVVILLAIGMLLVAGILLTHSFSQVHRLKLTPISFGSAVELNVTMVLSWLPLIGDYTYQGQQPVKESFVSVLGYFLGSCAMFILGLLAVIKSGQTNFNQTLAQTNLGIIALLIIIFATVTTTFMDAYSAATSLDNILHLKHVNYWAVGITILGLFIALNVSLKYYQNFLNFIGAIFTPLFAILFVSVFLIKKRLNFFWNFWWWLVGVALYYLLQKLDFIGGTTLLLLVVITIELLITAACSKKYDFK